MKGKVQLIPDYIGPIQKLVRIDQVHRLYEIVVRPYLVCCS